MTEKFKVVISGVSGRFPECDDVCTFKEKLYKGDNFITTDNRKWPVGWKHEMVSEKMIPDATGKMINCQDLDHTVFRWNRGNSNGSDILNRMILEPSFEAMVDAGVNPYSLDGTNVAVFISTSFNELLKNMYDPNIPSSILALIGGNKAMMSNRVSFHLNLNGSSLTQYVDAHGGLESLALGYRYVSEGFAEAALVGAASNILDPRLSLHYTSLGLLSPDGTTRPFDESANGYARSEGVVCFYIQRAEDAKRSYGEILFSDVFFCGSVLPNFICSDEEYLRTTMDHVYKVNKFDPKTSSLAFVEMNACGNKHADEVEANTMAELLSKEGEGPLMVGSIKSNVGHLEASAGFIAVLKAIMALDCGVLAPNLPLKKLNDDIEAFKQNRLQVVSEKTSLTGDTIIVNSIGLHGGVGVTVVKQNENCRSPKESTYDEKFPRIALICGREENSLLAKLTQIEKKPYNAHFIALLNDALGQYMPLHTYRGFTLVPPPFKPEHDLKETGERNRPVWFIFSGMGSQWPAMGKSLLNLPLFAETVAKCDEVLREKNIDIYKILTSSDPKLFDDIGNAFIGIITVQIGLFEVIKALGIEPDGFIGHSVGENGCAYADGCLTLEQAVLASWARGVTSNEVKSIKGMMAAVGMGYADMKDRLPDGIQVACHNSADSCTLTGPAKSVNTFVRNLKNENIFAKPVNVADIAYHSKYISELGPSLFQRLKEIIPEPKTRSSKWISTSVPEDEWDTPLAQTSSPEYFTNNLLSPVLFEEGCKHIPANAICIEFAPHGLLQAILKRCLPNTCTNIPLTYRLKTEENLNFLLAAIGKLYIAGLEPQVNNIFPALEYPAPRETPAVAPYCSWNHDDQYVPYHRSLHLEAIPMSDESIPIVIRDDSNYYYLRDHKINDKIIVPPSLFMYLAWQMLLHKRMENLDSSSVIFENVTIHQEVTMTVQDIKYAFVSMVYCGSGNFQVLLQDEEEESENFQIILTGQITLLPEDVVTIDQKLPHHSETVSKTSTRFYDAYKHAGYHLGENFVLVNDLHRTDSGYQTNITWKENWVTFLDTLMKVQMFADHNANLNNILPVRMRRLEILPSKMSSLPKGTLLPCKVDPNAKELVCSGVILQGLRYKSIFKTGKKLEEYRFISYQNPRCRSIREFLKFCSQIVVENVLTNVDKRIEPTISDTTRKKEYSQTIKQILQEEIPSDLTEESNSSRKTYTFSKEPILIIMDELEELKKLGMYDNNCPMVLLISSFSRNNDINLDKRFIEVTRQSFSVGTFTLLKKKCWTYKAEKSLVPLKDDQKEKVSEKMKDKSQKYFVIQSNIDIDDTSRLVGSKKVHPDAGYLYIMDDLIDSQKLDEMIKKQIDLGLCISVLKAGEWGSYRNLAGSLNEKHHGEVVLRRKQLLLNSRVDSSRIEYICLNGEAVKNDGTLETDISFAYSATTDGAKKVMGIATTISMSDSTQQELLWDIPSHWNSKDAAIVSYIYPQAYNLIFLTDKYPVECVLINVGGQYSLAEAIISLSLYRGFNTFVTVETDEEATLFEERFPDLKSQNIFRSWNYEYQLQIQRKGRGVNLVINFLKGKHHVEASLRCATQADIYSEIGDHNWAECSDIGMSDFLRAISFHPMKKGVSSLVTLCMETKKKIKLAIEELINKEVIAPLRIKKQTPSTKVIRYQPSEHYGSQVLDYSEKHSFIIVGADTKDYLWGHVIEWLICHGARNFIVFLEKRGLRPNTLHQINRLLAQKNVKILLVSSSKLDAKREISSFLNETEKLGSLKGIFFEATKLIEKKISNLDELVSPDIPFIGLSSGGLKEFENRRSKGSPAILVHCDKPKDALIALPKLHKLLIQDENNNAEVLYKVTDTNSSAKKNYNPRLHDYLPQDVETLQVIGQDNSEDFSFVEMCSLSSRYRYCKGVFPIFALPALHSVLLEPLFKRLMYPVFSAIIPNTCSIAETAQRLYQSLNSIQPSGPVTLISETWNLPLALELVTHLQLTNRKYKIFVLEANPENWMNQMGLDESGACNVDMIFHFYNKGGSFSDDSISSEDKIKMYAQNASADIRIVDQLIKAANKLCDKITCAAKQKFHSSGFGLLQNVTLFERYRPSDEIFKLSTSSSIIVVKETSYRNLLLHPEVGRIINENAEYSWS